MSLTPVPPPQHKAGDSFERLLTIPPEFADGFFVGWTPKSEIRNESGHLVAACQCQWLDPATTRHLSLSVLDTKGWKPGLVEIDVQFTRASDGKVMSTTTATFTVVKDVTQ